MFVRFYAFSRVVYSQSLTKTFKNEVDECTCMLHIQLGRYLLRVKFKKSQKIIFGHYFIM